MIIILLTAGAIIGMCAYCSLLRNIEHHNHKRTLKEMSDRHNAALKARR